MPDETTDAGEKLEKLGQRVRAGNAKQHPAQNLEAVRNAVREQYDQEQEAKRTKAVEPESPNPTKERQPEEPDHERD
jgi:hypothetical protein